MPAPRRRPARLVGAVLTTALVTGLTAFGWTPPANAATVHAVISTIPVGSALGDSLAVDSAAGRLYVSNPGANAIAVIDTTTNAVVDTIPVPSAGRIAFDPATDRLYVVSGSVDGVTVIDTTSGTVLETIPGFSDPIGITVDPGTHQVYVANLDSQTIGVIDTTVVPATVTDVGQPESRPWAIDVDPVTHRVYASTLFGGSVEVISGTAHQKSIYGFAGPIQVTVDPGSQLAYVINNNSDLVSMVDTSTDTHGGSFLAGSGPADIAVDQDTDTLYVANRNDDTVSVIDQATNDVIGTVAVGDHPTGIEVDPVTHRVYVANSDHTVSVIAPFETQEITFTSTAPTAATVGGDYTISALGGGSGNPVTFSVDPSTTNDACTISDDTVTFDAAGTCVIAAAQAGNDDYAAAPNTTQQFDVDLVPTTSTLSLTTDAVVFGEAATATVAVSGTNEGTVQFTLDGDPFGDPVTLDEDGEAASVNLTDPALTVGVHQVGADFTATESATFAGSSAESKALTVGKASTESSMAVTATQITSTVTVTAPGAGDPSGNVQFYIGGSEVGSAALVDGVATLDHVVPDGSAREVTALYSGDTRFWASSDSTSRQDPVITASVTSSLARRNGWYRTPVTVTFTCEETSAALTAPCPAPVTLLSGGANRSVSRTIMAVDGGAATVVVDGINIDRYRPAVRVTGVRAGATYFAAGPTAGCRASDQMSGVASCTVKRTTTGSRVVYVATATDVAGNRNTARLVARTTKVAISGASMRDGRYVVHRGRTYTVLVSATTRPSYLYATPAPGQPRGGNVPFKRIGKNKWALGVTFTKSMRGHTYWNIGTRVGSRTTVTTVRVVR